MTTHVPVRTQRVRKVCAEPTVVAVTPTAGMHGGVEGSLVLIAGSKVAILSLTISGGVAFLSLVAGAKPFLHGRPTR